MALVKEFKSPGMTVLNSFAFDKPIRINMQNINGNSMESIGK
jgi:hypothetical protein